MFLKISHGAFTSAILSKKANKQLFALCELTKCGVTVTQLVQVYCNIKRSVLEYASRVPQNLNHVTGSAKKKGHYVFIPPNVHYQDAPPQSGIATLTKKGGIIEACVNSREHQGTERDTPSHSFVICHSH